MPSLSHSKEVQSLYIAYFGRPADSMGLSYWSDVLENQGASLAAVAEGFSRSPEAISLYGSAVGTYEFVDRVYHHVFGRAADRVGLDYWGGQLSSGQLSAGSVVLAIVQGAVGSDFTIVQNKLLFAEAFSNLISQTNTLYAGEAAAAVARGLLNKITADTGAAQQATTQIGNHLYDLMLATTNPHLFTANISNHIWTPPAAGNAPSDSVALVISNFKPNGATTFTITANEAGLVGLKDSLGNDIGATTALLANTPTTVTVAPQTSVLGDVQVYVKDNAGNVTYATTKLVLGTSGNDTIDSTGKTAGEFIYGFDGNDTMTGGSGNDTMVGGSGNDTITGGGGADQLTGGTGADVFIYTTRDESYYAGAGTPLDTIVDFATGTDKIRFSLSGSAVDASSFATVGNFVNGKNNSIAYSTVDKALYVSATGTSLNNTTAGAYVVSSANAIAAADLQFVITGTAGDDVLKGGVGNDTISGGAGADTLTGGAGVDTFAFAAGDSTLANMDTITDYRAAGGNNAGAPDLIDLTGVTAVTGNHVVVMNVDYAGPLLVDALNAVAGINGIANGVSVFVHSGDTYVYVESNGAANTYQASDTVIKITGTPWLDNGSVVIESLGIDGIVIGP